MDRVRSTDMINIVAIGVTHWHSLYDAAYLPLLQQMPDVRIVALHCPAKKRGGRLELFFSGRAECH